MSRDADRDDVRTARPACPRLGLQMSKHRIARPLPGARRRPPADRMGPRLRHRARGHALLRHGTSAAIIGGLVLTAGFGLMACRTTTAQDAARAAAKARLLAYERHQYELQQQALARLRAQQEAAARAARLAALRTAQAAARARQLAAANAAAAAASTGAIQTSTPTSTSGSASSTGAAGSSSSSSSSSSTSSPTPSSSPTASATPPASSTPSAAASTPVAVSGGS